MSSFVGMSACIFITMVVGTDLVSQVRCSGLNGLVWFINDECDSGGSNDDINCPNGNGNECCVIYPTLNGDACLLMEPINTVGYTNLQIIFDINTEIGFGECQILYSIDGDDYNKIAGYTDTGVLIQETVTLPMDSYNVQRLSILFRNTYAGVDGGASQHRCYWDNIIINDQGTPPSISPTLLPTTAPTQVPSTSPSKSPINSPTNAPSNIPSKIPSQTPSQTPSKAPSKAPSKTPSSTPSNASSFHPSLSPSISPSKALSQTPSHNPSNTPSRFPTKTPSLQSIEPTLITITPTKMETISTTIQSLYPTNKTTNNTSINQIQPNRSNNSLKFTTGVVILCVIVGIIFISLTCLNMILCVSSMKNKANKLQTTKLKSNNIIINDITTLERVESLEDATKGNNEYQSNMMRRISYYIDKTSTIISTQNNNEISNTPNDTLSTVNINL